MDLDTAASYAEILGLVTILGAAIYSWFQIKDSLRRARDSTTAMSLAANFQDEDFVVGLTAIMNMDFDASEYKHGDQKATVEAFKQQCGEDWPKVMRVLTTWESIGVLIHRGDMDFHAFYDLFSGVIIKTYETFSFFFEPIRKMRTTKTWSGFFGLPTKPSLSLKRKGQGRPLPTSLSPTGDRQNACAVKPGTQRPCSTPETTPTTNGLMIEASLAKPCDSTTTHAVPNLDKPSLSWRSEATK